MIKFLKLYEKIGIFIFIFAGSVALSIATPNFLKLDTILNIIAQGTYAAIVGFGMTFAITSGGFDLSVESVMSLVSVFIAMLMPVLGMAAAIAVALVIGAMVGALNGTIISKLKVNPLITTLAMATIIKGAALLITGGRQIIIAQKSFMELGTGKMLGVPVPIYIMVFFFIVFYFVLYHSAFGRHVAAVGSNQRATKISGINVDMVTIGVYALVAFTSGITSVIRTSQALIGIPTMSPGFVLVVITVTILGGTSLTGGRGNLWGTLFAGIFISMIYYGLNLLAVQIYYQMLSVGIVLILALFIEGVRRRYLQVAKSKGIKV
ncbi:MAG: ABC transporter permease [Spirochaetales bacterium]|nr:MAG: ABC transporter permease [Spirochaetales bacterium]